jgi:hypothetical protein
MGWGSGMGVQQRTRTTIQPRGHFNPARRLSVVAAALALVAMLWLPSAVGAQDSGATKAHSLGVNLHFPDDGLVDNEQLCVALFSGTSPDLSQPPLLSRCLDPGNSAVTFEGLRKGDYSVLLPGPGSKLEVQRYQGQLVSTAIPDDNQVDDYGIDVNVALSPDYAGTTGRVEVSVYGCPAGTDAGNNRADWASECHALAGGVPLTLTGTGSINDAAFRGVTGVSGSESGRVEFSNLPAGAYELNGDLPENVSDTPALFAESSIDGSLGSLSPDDKLALRPAETVAVDVYLVLDPSKSGGSSSTVGLSDPTITGGIDGR